MYESILRKRSGIDDKLWKSEFEGETSKYFDVDQALKYNLIDDVIRHAEKKIKILTKED